MASSPLQIDFSGHLSGFLLRAYIRRIDDPSHPSIDRLPAQLELDAFLLRMGPEMLGPLQRALMIEEGEPEHEAPVADWFMGFIGGRDQEWLKRVNLPLLERFFRSLSDARTRRSAIDLILKVEAINDPTGATAEGSLVAGLFQRAQPEPFAASLTPDAALIIGTLAAQLRMLMPKFINTAQGSLGSYAMRVIRYCFKSRYQRFSPEEIDYISGLIEIQDEIRDRFRQILTGA